jgi:SAM-dependent methyltransferase
MNTLGDFTCLVCSEKKFIPRCNETLLRCSRCGFTTANALLSEDAIRKIYSEKYFVGEEYENYVRDKLMLQKNFYSRLKKIFSIVLKSEITDILEIGCAYGFFGELVKRELPHAQYLGFDVSADAVKFAKNNLGLNVSDESYLASKTGRKFSDVFMWDVIEHLQNPGEFIARISSDSASGSRLYLTTGDIGSWLARLQGCNWRMIHPPSHLHYFSKETITELLRKNGFKVRRILHVPVLRSAKGIFYSLFMLKKSYSHFTGKIYDLIPEKLSISVNTFDIMFVIAEKE